MTAMMLLTANNMHKLHHDKLFWDKHLVDSGLQMLDKIAEETRSELLLSFHGTCTELLGQAQQMHDQAVVMADNHDFCFQFPETLWETNE